MDVAVLEHEGAQEHAERLLPMAHELLTRAGLAVSDLDAVAFGQGPGGFTGLRVACGVAQGIALARGLPVVPVVSLQAVAARVPARPEQVVVVALDARMEEVYLGAYRRMDGAADNTEWEVLQTPVLIAAAQAVPWIEARLPDWRTGLGLPLAPVLAGDAWQVYAGVMTPSADWPCFDAQRPDVRDVALLGLQAWLRGGVLAPEHAAPLYVRDKVAFTTAERAGGQGGNPRAGAALVQTPGPVTLAQADQLTLDGAEAEASATVAAPVMAPVVAPVVTAEIPAEVIRNATSNATSSATSNATSNATPAAAPTIAPEWRAARQGSGRATPQSPAAAAARSSDVAFQSAGEGASPGTAQITAPPGLATTPPRGNGGAAGPQDAQRGSVPRSGHEPKPTAPAAAGDLGDGLEAASMRTEDLDDMAALEAAVQAFPWTRRNFADALAAGYESCLLRAGGRLLGFCVLMPAPDVSHLLVLAVDPVWQRRGLGTRLMQWCEARTRAHGLDALLLEVRPSNRNALSFYARQGFQQIGLRRDYYPAAHGAREDAVIMQKPVAADGHRNE